MQTENLLLSSSRSGTNFFLSVYARCFPKDFVAKEIFRPNSDSLPLLEALLGVSQEEIKALVRSDPRSLWQNIVARCNEADRRALVKIFYYHVDHGSNLWTHFKENTKIVHLIRRNQFDAFLSQKVAQQTGRWQVFKQDGDEDATLPPFSIDQSELESYLERQKEYVSWARRYFEGADYREVFYEDVSGSPKDCATEIVRIFERPCELKEITIGLKKQKTVSNAELVENYDALRKFDRPLF